MADDVMVSEYPDEEQRSAICHDAWKNRNNALMRSWRITHKDAGL